MNNYILTGFALAALALTGCDNDPMMESNTGGGNVQFTVQLPDNINSRAFSDGTTATKLTYALYDADGANVAGLNGEGKFTDLTTTVSLNLVTGKEYTIVFWADAPDNDYYTFNATTGKITVSNSGDSNDETRDAFFANYNFKVTGPINETIELKRPFAQINIGTSDLADFIAQKETITTSGMTVKGYKTLNLLDGSVEGEMVEYAFTPVAFPEGETFPYSPEGSSTTYSYLAMDYILMGADKEIVDVTWTSDNSITDRQSITFNSVPVQRNYRTNIFGALLTNPATFEVIIKPEYEGNYDNEVWDGKPQNPTETADGNYEISTVAQMMGFAKAINEGTTDYSGKTVKLTDDISLVGVNWTPIGSNADDSKKFKGTFDGQNHTITGLTINQSAAYHAAGLFGALNGTVKDLKIDGAKVASISAPDSKGNTTNGTAVVAGSIYPTGLIENVTVKNAQVSGNRYAGGIAGYVYGNVNNCTVDGITIVATPDNLYNSTYDNGDKAGAIIGYLGEDGNHSVTGNKVSNATITAYRDLGSIIGGAQSGATISGNTATNVELICDQVTNKYAPKESNAGEIIGRNLGNYDLSTVGTATNVTISIKGEAQITSSLAQGGNISIASAMSEIAIPTDFTKDLNLTINAKVDKITFPKDMTNETAITIEVAKDVDYPLIAFAKDSEVKNVTIKGDPASDKILTGFNFNSGTGLTKPALLENLTIEGVTFHGSGFEPKWDVSIKNIVIRNCHFKDMIYPAIDIQHHNISKFSAENMTIEGCTIDISSEAANNVNGLYLINIAGDIVVKDNTISNSHYHGMFLSTITNAPVFNATITGNKIIAAAQDGVKIENCTGAITVDKNVIDCKTNGIRLKNSIGTADVSVLNNSIDMNNAIDWDGDSEPSAILLINSTQNSGAKVVVKGNTVQNSNGHNFTVKNVAYADGSDVANPFK